ncbi:MAG: ABC transporter permease [Legionellales bacterium]
MQQQTGMQLAAKLKKRLDSQHLNLLSIAWKMLVNSRKRFIGMSVGATFSAFIIMQQYGIYQGVTDRIVAPIQAIQAADLWIMGESSFAFDQPTYFQPMDLYRIRSVPGVRWATQMYRTWYSIKNLSTQKTLIWELIGVDPKLLLGLPETMLTGDRASILHANAIVVDGYSLKQLETADKKTIQINDKMLVGRKTWTVTAVTKPLRTYAVQPKAYIASTHLPNPAYTPSFILVKVKPSANIKQVASNIHKMTHFIALTPAEFINRSNEFFRQKTPIIIIFIVVAIVGFAIGLVMMWQIFSNFVLTHLHQFGMLKMLGVSNRSLINMVLFQGIITGGVGYMAGLFLSVLFGFIFYDTTVAFHLTWKIALLGLLGSAMVIVFSAYFAVLKVLRLDTVELCRDTN